MARVFLIRHGEAAAAWGGDDDDPGLSAAGHVQAAAAAERLAGLGPLAALSSPMRRCRETAAPYELRRGGPALIEPHVSEVPTPSGVADRPSWLRQNFPWRGGEPRLWTSLDSNLKAWRDAVLARVRAIDEDTAVFSHFIAINVIVGAALDRPETIVCKPGYASITELSVSPSGLQLVRFGEEMQTGEVR